MEALRRPALPEDAVRSRLFAAAAAAGPGGEALLRRCAELALVRLAPLLAACVWQRRPFRLRYVPGRGEIPAHLGGPAVFGDNVEDEWFIVYLLREMSRELPGLAASQRSLLAVPSPVPLQGVFVSALAVAGDFHSVFVCTAGAAAVCSRQTQWIHPARPSSSSVQSLRAGHEAGNDSWGILALAHACAGNGSLSGGCLLVQRNVSKVCHTLRTSCCCIFYLQAHGFEMLCSKSSKVAPDAKRNVLRGPLWERFLRSLKEKDYFKGEMEGSAKYLELLHMAEDHFQQSVAVPESCDEVSPGDEILALLQTTPIDLKELEREAACLPAEDDDSWLDMTPGALDQMLKETRNESLPSPNEEEQNYDLETVAESMKAFVSKVSTHEGAEMPWSSDESQVTFDVDSFTKALDRILGADSEELDSDDVDEEEEFGFSDEDDEELDAGNGRQEQKVSPEELVGSLKAYMEEMDRELAQTNIGKSFSSHKRGASSVGAAPCESAGPDCGAEAAELAALDVDMNLVANLLESYSAQAGLAGPTSSILQSLGVNLPESSELTGS
ncbi:protein ecdysoneless homolog [Melospiza melodia melodia]|uniref:protein ecdysoneless homolog n=1 Tax=Melospiza melodia melodia TaxID=1914991 RepID=UPI002FD6120A